MLWSRSASLMITTRASSAMAMNIFRMFSACCSSVRPGAAELGQLGHPVDEAGHLPPEPLLDVDQRIAGVLRDVVEEAGGQGLGVHLERGQLVGDRRGVGDVRLAGRAQLPLVGGGGHLVGALDEGHVDGRPMAARLGDEVRQLGSGHAWTGRRSA